jgi:predicted transcriptional regulator
MAALPKLRASARSLATVEKHNTWIELRRQGYLETQIAARFGVSQQAVSKALLKYLRNLPQESADELRRIEAERLDALYVALAPGIAEGDPRCIEVAVRISERRSKLLGLDVPTKYRGPADGAPVVNIMNLMAGGALDIDELKRIQELDPVKKPDIAYLYEDDRAIRTVSDSLDAVTEPETGDVLEHDQSEFQDTRPVTRKALFSVR